MHFIGGVIKGSNVRCLRWFLSLGQDPEIGMLQHFVRAVNGRIANFFGRHRVGQISWGGVDDVRWVSLSSMAEATIRSATDHKTISLGMTGPSQWTQDFQVILISKK